jgi:hypothetical protein
VAWLRLWLVMILGCVAPLPVLAETSPGLLVLPPLEALATQAKESVLISLDSDMLATAALFLDSQNPQDRDVKDLISNLRGIYVRSYKFDHSVAYPAAAIDSIRKQLSAPCWKAIVNVRKAQEQSAVDIYICQIEQKARGLAIIATEPRELTIVNILGAIDMGKLRRLEGRFGIPRLSTDPASSAPNPPTSPNPPATPAK